MKLKIRSLIIIVTLLMSIPVISQVGIGNTDPKSTLDISASNQANPLNTDGILIPRIDAFPAVNPGPNQNAMLIYLTSAVGVFDSGFYYWNENTTSWTSISAIVPDDTWDRLGNAGTTAGTNFIGTTDNVGLDVRTNDVIRARFTTKGQLEILNTGNSIFIGEGAGASEDLSDNRVTLVGYQAGNTLTNAIWNTAVGYQALSGNATGGSNSMLGYQAGFGTTTSDNTGIGRWSMRHNTSGGRNIAIGASNSAYSNGEYNVAIGNGTMAVSNSGAQYLEGNTAIGSGALFFLRNGIGNVVLGEDAANFLEDGNYNIILGQDAGGKILSGSNNNIMIGRQVGGNSPLVVDRRTFQNSILLGFNAGHLEDEGSEDRLYIEHSGSRTPLIGGDFANDRVGINVNMTTTTPGVGVAPDALTHTLTVGGDVYASGGFQTPTNNYPDYVFEDYFFGNSTLNSKYRFTPLHEAISFVKENGHLPNVKSYKEIEDEGMVIDITETSIKNLEKIEENFLYIVELKGENEKLTKENSDLKEILLNLEQRIMAIEQKLSKKI